MFKAIGKLWRAFQRQTDMIMLWPVCRDESASHDEARAAFYLHVVNDPAWTTDFTESELIAFIDGLAWRK